MKRRGRGSQATDHAHGAWFRRGGHAVRPDPRLDAVADRPDAVEVLRDGVPCRVRLFGWDDRHYGPEERAAVLAGIGFDMERLIHARRSALGEVECWQEL